VTLAFSRLDWVIEWRSVFGGFARRIKHGSLYAIREKFSVRSHKIVDNVRFIVAYFHSALQEEIG
jgi:hypothetical protein